MAEDKIGRATTKQPVGWALFFVFSAILLGNNLFSKKILLLAIIYFVMTSFRSIKDIAKKIHRAYWLMLFEVWAALSIFWSFVPSVTKDLVILQIAFLTLCLLMANYSVNKDLGRTLKITVYFVISVVVLYSLAFPMAVISPSGFKAFYANKNNLGLVMAVCVLILLYCPRVRWFDFIFVAVAFVLLVVSQSKTSLIVLLAIIVLTFMMRLIAKIYASFSAYVKGVLTLLSKVIPSIVLITAILCVFYRENIADFLIQVIPNDFMTGRGELWVTVLRRTKEDLLWGIGPGTFWEAGLGSEIAQTDLLQKHPGWIDKLGSADGGYIDLIGSFGFVGFALLVASFVSNYQLLIRIAAHQNCKLMFVLITFFIAHNVTETTIYHSTNANWFIYLFSSFYIIFLYSKEGPPSLQSHFTKVRKSNDDLLKQ